MLENKLNLYDSAALAREEERISKKKAAELFEKHILDNSANFFLIHTKSLYSRRKTCINQF